MLVKMNLSRAAKKLRDQTSKPPEALKSAPATKKTQSPPAPAAVPPAVEPVAAPVPEVAAEAPEPAAAPPAQEEKPAKVKRPRFVREKSQKRERPAGTALPPRSTKATAQLLTKNLAPLPPDDTPKA